MAPWDNAKGVNPVLMLLTPEEFLFLPDGAILTCIDGSKAVKGKDYIDDDTRGGHLAYGITVELDYS